jgi:pyruvate dehydrogenase E1 component alpha subunit
MAGLLKVPAIFIVENNGVAMGTQVVRSSAESDLAKRGNCYGMPARNIDGNDVDVVIAEMSKAADRARHGEGPSYIVANTYRFRGHSMSDAMKYRSKEEMEKAKSRDPIAIYEIRLREKGLLTDEQAEAMEEEVSEIVADAVRQADADPHPQLQERFDDILSENYPYDPDRGDHG